MAGPVDITPVIPADRQVIDSCQPGYFRVSNTVHAHPIVVFPDRTVAWPVAAFDALTVEDFALVTAAEPKVEVLLLGSGPRMALPPKGLRQGLKAAGLSVDVMETGAACRTYTVLLAEGRRVAAALFPL